VAAGLTLLPTAAFASGKGTGSVNGVAKGLDKSTPTTTAPAASGSSVTPTVTIPTQPLSNADQNNTGANDTTSSNQYLSTRNGAPSLNGNGGGKATGKPCAACVGKADNKNPPGQYAKGSDHNAGYECDRNQGIGKSNPAHTGCTPPTTAPPTSTPPPSISPNTPPTSTDPCANPNPAARPSSCSTTSGTTVRASTALGHSVSPSVALASAPVHATGSLAFTGANAVDEVWAGALALGVGSGLLWLTRRRRSSPKS
jgi:hypothetical protein